jgi:hypothetical protein
MASMMDRTNVVAPTMDFWLHGSSAPTAPTQPFHLRLMTAQGSNTGNGTEATSSNCPGYTAGGASMGSPAFGANASGVSASGAAVTWTASGSWTGTPAAAEVWDTTGTPKRIAQGALSANITGVANGDTVTFATGAVTLDSSAW